MLLREATRNKNNQELVKDSIDALIEALEAGHSEALPAYLTAMSQFHTYSFQNILLIASQRPTATRVAGIRSWNELGRRVKRGEKGIPAHNGPSFFKVKVCPKLAGNSPEYAVFARSDGLLHKGKPLGAYSAPDLLPNRLTVLGQITWSELR